MLRSIDQTHEHRSWRIKQLSHRFQSAVVAIHPSIMSTMQCVSMLILLQLSLCHSQGSTDAVKARLEAALKVAESTLVGIYTRWEIGHYPKFLQAAAMTHKSWEVLKLKYQSKIMDVLHHNKNNTKFVISFTGSSVTAGHDTVFNETVTEIAGRLLNAPFGAVGIDLISRNAALGNNPCSPYMACVRTFAGSDADMVHWEQSYNCFPSDSKKQQIFEQFARQAVLMPNKPVVVYSDSSTPNWAAKDCPKGSDHQHKELDEHEKKLLEQLSSDPVKLVTESNKGNAGTFSGLSKVISEYKTAGIQLWLHNHYEPYKCRGPYIADWGCCSASWHPSKLGHELRAAHFSFFWTLIFKDALNELLSHVKNGDSLSEVMAKIEKKQHSEAKYMPTLPLYNTEPGFEDHLSCYTTFQPLGDPSLDLRALVVKNGASGKGFTYHNIDEVEHKDTIKRAKERGYKDFKTVLSGNKEDGPLSLKIKVSKRGTVYLCEPAGIWGHFPKGYSSFWKTGTKIYINENAAPAEVDVGNFVFSADRARELTYTNQNPKDTQTICVNFDEKIAPGIHVLTVVPTSEQKVMVAYLVLP